MKSFMEIGSTFLRNPKDRHTQTDAATLYIDVWNYVVTTT